MAWEIFHEIGRKIIHITILIVLAVYFVILKNIGKQFALLFLIGLLIILLTN